jgi:hypothetical protein
MLLESTESFVIKGLIMDSVVAQLLARLSMFLTQELDLQVDTQRFATEPEYASQVLGLAEEMGNHEFKSIAGRIRKRQQELLSLNKVIEPLPEGDTTALSTPNEAAPQSSAGQN